MGAPARGMEAAPKSSRRMARPFGGGRRPRAVGLYASSPRVETTWSSRRGIAR